MRVICARADLNTCMNMDDVWHTLENSVSPEVTHFQRGTHPGPQWWLKTAVVKQDVHLGTHTIWQALSLAHPRLIKITPHCWDWHQNLIPWAHTVWIKMGRDVQVELMGTDWVYHVISDDIGNQIWCETLDSWVKSAHNRHMKKTDPTTWHKWKHSLQLLQAWRSEHQAQQRRKQIKAITHEKDTGLSSHS
jgi:hypothetical protein